MIEKYLTFWRNRVPHTLFLSFLLAVILVICWIFVPMALDRIKRNYQGIPSGVRIGEVEIGGYYPTEVKKLLLSEADKAVRWPVSAKIDHEGIITPAIWGQILDIDATMQAVLQAKADETIQPQYCSIYPVVISEEILKLTRPIGVYHTFVAGEEPRVENIRLAGKFINYTLLMPGEIFSFNKTVGPPSPERGFQKAPIIVGEEIVPGYGGGICQVSSTLYNAALNCKLKILERYSHSKNVSYVPPGKDATVAYDYLDLKLENTRNHPILIKVSLWGRRLQVGIYGPSV